MKTTNVSIALDLRDVTDRLALKAVMRVYDDPEPIANEVTAHELRESGKEITKAAGNIEALVGPKKVMTRSEKARLAATKRWEKERASKPVKVKPEHRDFQGEQQESADNYEEIEEGWPDGRDIMEAAKTPPPY